MSIRGTVIEASVRGCYLLLLLLLLSTLRVCRISINSRPCCSYMEFVLFASEWCLGGCAACGGASNPRRYYSNPATVLSTNREARLEETGSRRRTGNGSRFHGVGCVRLAKRCDTRHSRRRAGALSVHCFLYVPRCASKQNGLTTRR